MFSSLEADVSHFGVEIHLLMDVPEAKGDKRMSPAEDAHSNSQEKTTEFLRLLRSHESGVIAVVYSLVDDWGDAQEVIQDVRIRLWELFPRETIRDFGPWSRAVAVNVVREYRAKKGRAQVLLSDEALEGLIDETESMFENVERRHEALSACLDELEEGKRDLIFRWYAKKQSTRQIASDLKRGYEATRKSIFRIRTWLKNCVEQRLAQEEST